jgi:VanZ family protein
MPPVQNPDLWLHAVAYGGQAVLAMWFLAAITSELRAAAGAWTVATALGLGTELLQRLQPARTAELRDLVADAAGAAIAVVGVLVIARLLRRRSAKARLERERVEDQGAEHPHERD